MGGSVPTGLTGPVSTHTHPGKDPLSHVQPSLVRSRRTLTRTLLLRLYKRQRETAPCPRQHLGLGYLVPRSWRSAPRRTGADRTQDMLRSPASQVRANPRQPSLDAPRLGLTGRCMKMSVGVALPPLPPASPRGLKSPHDMRSAERQPRETCRQV